MHVAGPVIGGELVAIMDQMRGIATGTMVQLNDPVRNQGAHHIGIVWTGPAGTAWKAIPHHHEGFVFYIRTGLIGTISRIGTYNRALELVERQKCTKQAGSGESVREI